MNRGFSFRAAVVTAAIAILMPAGLAHADDPSPTASPSASGSSSATAHPSSSASATPSESPTTTPSTPPSTPPTKPTPAPKPERTKLPLKQGHYGSRVATAQQRLAWLGYEINPNSVADEYFGKTTEAAVKKFQVKFFLKPTGKIDTRTWRMIKHMAEPVGVVPLHCTEVKKAICADKTAKIIRYVANGKVKLTVDARFGLPGMDTGEGIFTIHEKAYDHVSSLYHTWMPRAMFFNGDQAVHYSPYFLHDGYYGGSHGCIGIREMDKVTWLFGQMPTGGRVYVYRS